MRQLKFITLLALLLVLTLLGQMTRPAVASPLLGFTSTPVPTPMPTPTPVNTPVPGPVVVEPIITKTVDIQLAQVGDPVKFTLTAFNPNAIDVMSVVVEDPLPPEIDFVSATVTQGTFFFEAGTNTIKFDIGTIGAGQSVTMVIQTRINERGQPQQELRNTTVLWVSGTNKGSSNTVSVTIIPLAIPGTGLPPAPSPLPTALLAVLVALVPPVLWLAWRRVRRA
jgi:uncharacterized repeat protein (TIGR01451 family)